MAFSLPNITSIPGTIQNNNHNSYSGINPSQGLYITKPSEFYGLGAYLRKLYDYYFASKP